MRIHCKIGQSIQVAQLRAVQTDAQRRKVMNTRLISIVIAVLLLVCLHNADVYAQTESSSWEAGVQMMALHYNGSGYTFGSHASTVNDKPRATDVGIGGRISFNAAKWLALESELNFFPREFATSQNRTQALFGVKTGRRFGKVGLFAKVRPGVMRFSEGQMRSSFSPGDIFRIPSKTVFALDVGGVIEINHSRRVFTRLDFGDTMLRTTDRLNTNGSAFIDVSRVKHGFQFSAGIGFRF